MSEYKVSPFTCISADFLSHSRRTLRAEGMKKREKKKGSSIRNTVPYVLGYPEVPRFEKTLLTSIRTDLWHSVSASAICSSSVNLKSPSSHLLCNRPSSINKLKRIGWRVTLFFSWSSSCSACSFLVQEERLSLYLFFFFFFWGGLLRFTLFFQSPVKTERSFCWRLDDITQPSCVDKQSKKISKFSLPGIWSRGISN